MNASSRSTVIRWTGGGSVVALLAFALLVPRERAGSSRTAIASRADSAFIDFRRARQDERILLTITVRARAFELARALPSVATDSPILRTDPRIPNEVRARLRSALDDEIRAAGSGIAQYPIAVIVAIDTGMESGGYRHTTVLPDAAGQPCTVVLESSLVHRGSLWVPPTSRLLGPCAFYAAHGAPGPSTGAWLRETRSRAAEFLQLPAAFVQDTSRAMLGLYGGSLSPLLAQCRSGLRESCSELFASVPVRSRPFDDAMTATDSLAATVFRGSVLRESGAYPSQLQVLYGGILGALAADLGRERFGELWRGQRAIPEAFSDQQGRPFDAWVSEYIARHTLPYHRGPGIPFLSSLLALGLVATALGVATRRSPRGVS